MEKLWPMKKKKGGADILTNMLLSEDGAPLHSGNQEWEPLVSTLSHR